MLSRFSVERAAAKTPFCAGGTQNFGLLFYNVQNLLYFCAEVLELR